MKKNHNLKINNKKSFMGIMLALVLMISFNFSPLCVFVGAFSNRKANAYSSTATKNYYGPNLVTTESGFSSPQYPDGMKEYFSNSNSNFKIKDAYNKEFEKWFKKYANDFVASLDETSAGYDGKYAEFLSIVGCTTLSEYYEANSSKEGFSEYPDFRGYFEHFLTSETKYKDENLEEKVLPAIYDLNNLIANFYQTRIYNPLANFIETAQKGSLVQIGVTENDGLSSNSNFYTDSVSYKRVKAAIDLMVAKTTPLYGFDGATQDDYSASINASNAPISKDFYYKENDFENEVVTNISFNKTSSKSANQVYYFGEESELSTNPEYVKFTNGGENAINFLAVSEFEATPIYYRLIQEGEFGYIDSTHPTFYKYTKLPYEILNSIYKVYVVDDNVTDSERATYSSLYYVDVITSDDITKDNENIKTENTIVDTTGCYYVQIPYFFGNTNYDDLYFKKLFSNNAVSDYSKLINLFVDSVSKTSKAYLKVTSTETKRIVYVDNLESFNQAVSSYNYEVRLLELGGDDNLTMDDYSRVTSADSKYYTDKYPELYFKKNRTPYSSTTNNEYGDYLKSPTPTVSYVEKLVAGTKLNKDKVYSLLNTHTISDIEYKVVSSDVLTNGLDGLYLEVDIPSRPNMVDKFYYKHTVNADGEVESGFEMNDDKKVIYVNVESVTIGGNSYSVITDESFEVMKDFYVEVTSEVYKDINGENNENGSSKLYYKHEDASAKKIYVVASDANALNKAIYKNLGYTFISTEDFKTNFYKFVAIPSTDENYNKNFALYYQVDSDNDSKHDYQSNRDMFVHNEITDKNAVYIIDDSLTSTDKATYRSLFYTSITTAEFNKESQFYVKIDENDDNYSSVYTKLYYKYTSSNEVKNDVYLYSSSASSNYKTFSSSDKDYDPNAYVKIEAGDPNYVKGLELYYKKELLPVDDSKEVVGETTYNYYYYQTSAALELKANQYYAISFYVYTNGNYYDANGNLVTDNEIQASVYIKDTKKIISDIEIENISTNGKWVKYTAFVATNVLSASNVLMYFQLGDDDSIAGTTGKDAVNGLIIFDNIAVTLIGKTDYETKSIDGVKVSDVVYDTEKEEVEFPIVTDDEVREVEGLYEKVTDLQVAEDMRLDDSEFSYYYKHTVGQDGSVDTTSYEKKEYTIKGETVTRNAIYAYVVTNETTSTTRKINVFTKYDELENRDIYKNESIALTFDNRLENDDIFADWNTTFDFDNYVPDADHADLENLEFDENADGFNADLSDWHYYISRGDSGQGNFETLKALRNAYKNGKAEIEFTLESTIDKTIKEDEKDEEDKDKDEDKEEDKKEESEDKKDEDKEESKDVPTIGSTFNENNKVLMINNKDKIRSLGVASKTFTVKQNEYLKVTVWIYSPDKEATATIKLESVLKTASTENNGSLIESTASNISAYMPGYSKAPTNEYSWIPVSFFIEGNAYHNQDFNVVLLSDAKSKVYFDNITIERTTSSNFDTAKSDSDNLTFCLSLSPTKSVISSGVTNGYFDLSTLLTEEVDYSAPRTAENWKASDSNTAGAIAGVIPTSEDYFRNANNGADTFYTKYNDGKFLSPSGFANNVFAIYAPETVKASLANTTDNKDYKILTDYKIYSASTSISAGKLYEISFEVATGSKFTGDIVSTLYFSSVSKANVIADFSVKTENVSGNNSNWTKYTYYVLGGTASTNVYLEIGVENAVGVAFFQKVSCVTSSHASLEAARDSIINHGDYSAEGFSGSLADYPSLAKVRFADLSDSTISMNQSQSDKYENVYPNTNYGNSDINSSTYTVGSVGTVISSFYTSTKTTTYTAKIDSLKFIKDSGTADAHDYSAEVDADKVYYIKPLVEDAKENGDFKLYSDSMFTVEVAGFDINFNGKVEDSEIGNYEIKLVGETVKVVIDENETDSTEVVKTTYKYNFTEDISMGNNLIPASELNNNYSDRVLVISNNYSTDYTVVNPALKGSLSSSAFYVLKVYAKVGNISLYNEDSDKNSGLNITVDSVTVNWNNIKENGTDNVDENGFTCYELWITTNTSSFSELKVKFSLGSKDSTCSGYAIIADVSLEKFSTETLFNEYVDAKEELYNADSSSSIAKRYFGKESTKKDDSTSTKKDEESSIWATFFYVFSSLLLGIVLIMAFVATYLKKHPIKSKKVKVSNNDEIIVVNPTKNVKEEDVKPKETPKKKENTIDLTTEETQEAEVAETTETSEVEAENAESNDNAEADNQNTEESKKDNEVEGF